MISNGISVMAQLGSSARPTQVSRGRHRAHPLRLGGNRLHLVSLEVRYQECYKSLAGNSVKALEFTPGPLFSWVSFVCARPNPLRIPFRFAMFLYWEYLKFFVFKNLSTQLFLPFLAIFGYLFSHVTLVRKPFFCLFFLCSSLDNLLFMPSIPPTAVVVSLQQASC